jgi:class I fructose-bisphosphate aldolase
MLKGAAMGIWEPYAGKIPLIISSVLFTQDDAVIEVVAAPEEVSLLGADAIAVAIGVRGPNEGRYLKILATAVEQASRLNLPVFAHLYPRDFSGNPKIVHDPENIMWAVRCGIECGADVIKVPFTGDMESFQEIIAVSPVPVVAAGGPKCDTLEEALQSISLAMSAGARGATIGRNIWGNPDPVRALTAFKAVIHDGLTPEEALETASLCGRVA